MTATNHLPCYLDDCLQIEEPQRLLEEIPQQRQLAVASFELAAVPLELLVPHYLPVISSV
jgi:hypothetical protein